ncbi:MAG: DUF1918 domain-containing protein [Acidimicrobiales bacterium]
MADIGDRVQVPSSKLGQPPRDGVVTGVTGHLVRVKWSSGEESTVVPAVGSLVVIGKVKVASKQAKPSKAKLSKAKLSKAKLSKATGMKKSAR